MATLDDNIIKLIEATVRQILSDTGIEEQKKHYLLLWPGLLSDAKAAAEMMEKLNEYSTVTIAAGSAGTSTVYSRYSADLINTDSEAGRNKLLDRLGRFDGVICVQPQLYFLRSLASFDDSSFEAFAVFQALMLGLDVKMAVSPVVGRARYMSAGKGPFENQIAEIFDAVKQLGIDIDFSADKTESHKNKAATLKSSPAAIDKGKQLVTEKVIVEQYNKGVQKIIIDSNTIVTPLAKDKARELGLNFEVR